MYLVLSSVFFLLRVRFCLTLLVLLVQAFESQTV